MCQKGQILRLFCLNETIRSCPMRGVAKCHCCCSLSSWRRADWFTLRRWRQWKWVIPGRCRQWFQAGLRAGSLFLNGDKFCVGVREPQTWYYKVCIYCTKRQSSELTRVVMVLLTFWCWRCISLMWDVGYSAECRTWQYTAHINGNEVTSGGCLDDLLDEASWSHVLTPTLPHTHTHRWNVNMMGKKCTWLHPFRGRTKTWPWHSPPVSLPCKLK